MNGGDTIELGGDLYSTGSDGLDNAPVDVLVGKSDQQHAPADPPRIAAPPAAAPARPIVKELRPVSDDDDQATAATVKMMCDYIAQGIKDPVCRMWASHALSCYGLGRTDPGMLCWAVFWCLKHSVKYVRDEPALFRMGDGDARDLLTAPAVLVRQDEPKEDCDGFTMLACTLLSILGVKCYIVTVKADPKQPSRWSHVFAIADLGKGKTCAIDGSHGGYPGWMVPQEHIFASQVWDLSGSPIDMKLPARSQLNGYVRRGRGRGLGDICYDDQGNPYTCDTNVSQVPTESPYPVVSSVPIIPSSTVSSPFNLNALLASLIGNAAKVATVAEAPPGSIVNPTTGQIITGQPGAVSAAALTSGLSAYMPLIIGGVVIFGLVSVLSSGGRRK